MSMYSYIVLQPGYLTPIVIFEISFWQGMVYSLRALKLREGNDAICLCTAI